MCTGIKRKESMFADLECWDQSSILLNVSIRATPCTALGFDTAFSACSLQAPLSEEKNGKNPL